MYCILLLIINKCQFDGYYACFLTYDRLLALNVGKYLINVNTNVTFMIRAYIIFVAIN
jgi:hypothetical protein